VEYAVSAAGRKPRFSLSGEKRGRETLEESQLLTMGWCVQLIAKDPLQHRQNPEQPRPGEMSQPGGNGVVCHAFATPQQLMAEEDPCATG
jgi:hypothetical protein